MANNSSFYYDYDYSDYGSLSAKDIDSVVNGYSKPETIPITVIYVLLFVVGFFGNISTCIVIYLKSYLRTPTNLYLFSLAISDLLILLLGVPFELYELWGHHSYDLGDVVCKLRNYLDDICAYSSVLTITTFTVARYYAVCHPTEAPIVDLASSSQLCKTRKKIALIWFATACLAIPTTLQFVVIRYSYELPVIPENSTEIKMVTYYLPAVCSFRKGPVLLPVILTSSIILFLVPMFIITVLYSLIARTIRQTSKILKEDSDLCHHLESNNAVHHRIRGRTAAIKMLVVVVVIFFICWIPFHVQRILVVIFTQIYDKDEDWPDHVVDVLHVLFYVSGVLLFFSCAVNPIVYSLFSPRFRSAFISILTDPTQCWKPRNKRPRIPPKHIVWDPVRRAQNPANPVRDQLIIPRHPKTPKAFLPSTEEVFYKGFLNSTKQPINEKNLPQPSHFQAELTIHEGASAPVASLVPSSHHSADHATKTKRCYACGAHLDMILGRKALTETDISGVILRNSCNIEDTNRPIWIVGSALVGHFPVGRAETAACDRQSSRSSGFVPNRKPSFVTD